MTQEQFENRLLDSLMHEWTPATKRRRLPGGRMTVLPVVVAALVAATLITTQSANHDGTARTADVAAGDETPTTLLHDPQLIVSEVKDKVERTRDLLFHMKQTTWQNEDRTGNAEVFESWNDLQDNTFRNVDFDVRKNARSSEFSGDALQKRTINYVDKTVATCDTLSSPAGTRDVTANLVGDIKSDTLLGHENINGVDTLHLSDSEEGMNREIWVDAASLLPVRMTAHGEWGSYVFDYDWLPRSDANMKELQPTALPAGFKDISASACKKYVNARGEQNPGGTAH